jgi:protein ImuA
MIEQLHQRLQALQKPAGIADGARALPLGIAAIDTALGGGLARGALHEIAAVSEAHLAAATGFAIAVSSLSTATRAGRTPSPLWGEGWGEGVAIYPSSVPPHPTSLRSVDLSPRAERGKSLVWLAEDMVLAESGAPYGPGLDTFGFPTEHLLTVAAARPRDLLWAIEEALRCRAVHAVIGELRRGEIDRVAIRRLSLAAAESGALALLLRARPASDASTAATRWIVGAAPSAAAPDPGLPRFATQLVRNRRGPLGSWIIEWSDSDERFLLATHAQPVAAPALDRPHRQIEPKVA